LEQFRINFKTETQMSLTNNERAGKLLLVEAHSRAFLLSSDNEHEQRPLGIR